MKVRHARLEQHHEGLRALVYEEDVCLAEVLGSEGFVLGHCLTLLAGVDVQTLHRKLHRHLQSIQSGDGWAAPRVRASNDNAAKERRDG